MPVNFKFEDAPAAMTRVIDPQEIAAAEQLRKNPGQEARVFEYDAPKTASVTARLIKKGTRPAFGPGFSARARTVNGKGVVYVMYVGELSD